MRFNNYLTEAKQKIEYTGKEKIDNILGQVEKWRKDLRKMTKIFRSLEYPETEKEVEKWEEARKLFGQFRENLEDWIYNYIIQSESVEKESFWESQIRSSAHQASIAIGTIFKDATVKLDTNEYANAIDAKKTLKDRDKNIQDYNKKFRILFNNLQEYAKSEAEFRKEIKRIENFNYLGVDITIDWENEEREKWVPHIKEVLNNLQNLLDKIKEKDLDILLEDLKLKFDLSKGATWGGEYDNAKDSISLSFWTLANNNQEYRHVFFHEIAHRYWFKYLPNESRERWKDALQENWIEIETKHIEDFVNKYFPFDNMPEAVEGGVRTEELKDFFMDNEEEVENIAIYSRLWYEFDRRFKSPRYEGEFTKEKVIEDFKKKVKGLSISQEFISIYADKNADEAFAEAVATWLNFRLSRLPQKVRYVLKSIFESQGIKIEESKLKNYLLDMENRYE